MRNEEDPGPMALAVLASASLVFVAWAYYHFRAQENEVEPEQPIQSGALLPAELETRCFEYVPFQPLFFDRTSILDAQERPHIASVDLSSYLS